MTNDNCNIDFDRDGLESEDKNSVGNNSVDGTHQKQWLLKLGSGC